MFLTFNIKLWNWNQKFQLCSMRLKISSRWIALISLGGIFLMHLPFLYADPDIHLCCSRDAWGSEGLTVIQVRNLVTQGYLSFTESDNLLKMPLFNLIMLSSFNLFGTDLLVARLTSLIIVLASVFIAGEISGKQKFTPLLFVVVLLQYQTFQYSHMVMSEMTGIAMLVLSGAFFLRSFHQSESRSGWLFISSLFVVFSYWIKVQFAYFIPLLPLTIMSSRLFKIADFSRRDAAFSLIWQVFFAGIYFLVWYWPHRNFYNQVMLWESAGRFTTLTDLPNQIWINVKLVLLSIQTRWFIVPAGLAILAGIYAWLRSGDSEFRILFLFLIIILILESHKLLMTYLPPRYQVSIYFFTAFTAAASLIYSYENSRHLKHKILVAVLFAALVVKNGVDYFETYTDRQYSVWNMNNYVNRACNRQQTILGSWAPAITWQSKSRAIPVWKDIIADSINLRQYHARAVVADLADPDSTSVFIKHGINLSTDSDSSRRFSLGPWKLEIFWLHK